MEQDPLYKLIQQAVVQRTTAPPREQTQSFAQHYCQSQLKKKRFMPKERNKVQEMLKNFNNTRTFCQLPEVLALIDSEPKPIPVEQRSFMSRSQHRPKLEKISIGSMTSVRLGWQKPSVREALRVLEQQVSDNDMLGNHFSGVGMTFQQGTDQTVNHKHQETFKMLAQLSSNNFQNFTEGQETNYKQTKLNSQNTKEKQQMLHKAATYLQIILEKEHKNKWSKDRLKQKIIATQGDPTEPRKNSQSQHVMRRVQSQSIKKRTPRGTHSTNKSNTTTTTQEAECQMQAKMALNKARKMHIRDTFTFRKRGVKQRIIKQLDRFIGGIEEQKHNSREQNHYYQGQINKLEGKYKGLYSRFKRESLIEPKDIEYMRKLNTDIEQRVGHSQAVEHLSNSQCLDFTPDDTQIYV